MIFTVSAAEKNWKCGTRVTVAAEKLGSIHRAVSPMERRPILQYNGPYLVSDTCYAEINGVLQRGELLGNFQLILSRKASRYSLWGLFKMNYWFKKWYLQSLNMKYSKRLTVTTRDINEYFMTKTRCCFTNNNLYMNFPLSKFREVILL